MTEVAQHQPEEVRTSGRQERGTETRRGAHRRKKVGGGVMSIVSRIPGFGTEGRHSPAGRRRAEAVRVPDASRDNFSVDPYSGRNRSAERAVVEPRIIEAPVVERAAVEAPAAPDRVVSEPDATTETTEAPYVPEPSNIRPELPVSYAQPEQEYTGGHRAPEVVEEYNPFIVDEPAQSTEHAGRPSTLADVEAREASIVGQSFDVETPAHRAGDDENVIGTAAWRAAQQARMARPTVEAGTQSDPNVIGSKGWFEARPQPKQTTEQAGTETESTTEVDSDSDPNVIGSSAWREARKLRNYGPEPRYIDHEIAANTQRKAAAAAELPAVTDESRNMLARVYNNLRSHRRNQGRHAAVGTTGNRRFSFLSRNKGKHRA